MKWFLPALERTLGEKLVLPKRKVSDPKEFLRLFPESYKQLSLMAPNDRYKGRKTARGKDEGVGDAIPDDIPCFVDNGFQGIEKASPRLTVIMPKKKPRGGELSTDEKENNKEISKRRILSEHSIGGVKRYGIVSDVYRNHRKGFDDEVMLVSCGLWNYHLKTA